MFVAGCMVFSCAREKKTKPLSELVLAKVGDRVITAEEFKYSYEFSFAPLRQGPDPRRTYLDYMVKELLLANEGYRLGLHKSRYVASRVANRRRNDLLEAFYLKHVHSRVKIPEDELQKAIQRGTIKWRMIIWPTPSLDEAQKALIQARKTDLKDFIAKQQAFRETPQKGKRQYETDWIDYLDLQPEAFERIKDLEIGKVSDPIPYGNGYALVQITDINRQGIKEEELHSGAKRKQMADRLHDIEADRIVHSLMDSLITPLDVRVKGGVVEAMAPALYDWIREGLPETSVVEAVQNAPDTAKAYLKQLRALKDQTLLTYRGGSKAVLDYLAYMNYYRRPLKQSRSYEEFKETLITEIGTMFKNEQFMHIAEQEGYADSAHIVEDLRRWERKWTYDVYRAQTVRDLTVSEAEMHDFFRNRWRELLIADVDTTRFYKYEHEVHNLLMHEKHLQRLQERLTELEKRYPVFIDEALLSKLALSDSARSNLTSFFVRKNFTGEALVPIVDMKWLRF
ncbi:peptidyl-prolyl cis-trans isomerase [bacterium]|nr:peptidyl-prolyl cis-trans isomerase [bacterium]